MNELTLQFAATPDQAQLGAMAATNVAAAYYSMLTGRTPAPDSAFTEGFELALGEACSNSARHRYQATGADIKVIFSLDDSILRIAVCDQNQPFDFSAIPAPDFAAAAESGYGIYLMKKSVDKVSYQRKDGWNILTLSGKINP